MSKSTKKLEVESIDQILEKIKKAINEDTKKLDKSATNESSENFDEDDDILELTNIVSQPKTSEPADDTHGIEDENLDLISQHVQKFTRKLNLLMQGNYVVSEKEVREIFKETLRPYLKSWLNNNLKDIVKDVLEVEVKKIFKKII
jgi:cell pole-organizing protein PopZ